LRDFFSDFIMSDHFIGSDDFIVSDDLAGSVVLVPGPALGAPPEVEVSGALSVDIDGLAEGNIGSGVVVPDVGGVVPGAPASGCLAPPGICGAVMSPPPRSGCANAAAANIAAATFRVSTLFHLLIGCLLRVHRSADSPRAGIRDVSKQRECQ